MKNRGLIAFLVILVLLLAALAGGLIFYIRVPKDRLPVGSYERYFDLGDTADEKAKAFLSEAVMGDEATFSPDKKADSIRLLLSVSKDGVLKRSIDPGSYKEAGDALTDELVRAFRSLIGLRIEKAGLGDISDDEIDRLFQDEFGMSIADYISQYGPEMLPPFEDLSGRFDATARCKAEDGQLVFPDGTKIGFLMNDDLLVLQYESGETEVYTKIAGSAEDASGSAEMSDDKTEENADEN